MEVEAEPSLGLGVLPPATWDSPRQVSLACLHACIHSIQILIEQLLFSRHSSRLSVEQNCTQQVPNKCLFSADWVPCSLGVSLALSRTQFPPLLGSGAQWAVHSCSPAHSPDSFSSHSSSHFPELGWLALPGTEPKLVLVGQFLGLRGEKTMRFTNGTFFILDFSYLCVPSL